ncbi:hypothetical protein GCM10011579_077630 [Streptomyces albiflavescens]|uniref:Chitinase n=1 Tax=Streptomyces albiflavescens TaxID=1623582 RepID=A0A917YCQ1_9ACTN|nr:hypothetical protein [Streptomyces albiflavescens]GGN86116.1 hypothetical protein GCM10011579_077630 [Streptomyces albiflavescens]
MRIRRILAAVIATAALAGLGLTSAATATAGTVASLTPGECEQGGGTVNWANNTCKGGTGDGQMVD